MHRLIALAVAGLLALGAGAAATAMVDRSDGGAPAPTDVAQVVTTSLPGLSASSTDPGLAAQHPAPGTVAQAPGPFDDRFTLEGARFDRTGVSATVHITSDVSELMDLQVQVGFYDARGQLLGSSQWEQHGDGHTSDDEGHIGPPEQRHPVSVALPAGLSGRAVSAALAVTVLVNE